MGDRCGMSISAEDETLNRGRQALLLRRQYEFPFGINIVQFSFFFSIFNFNHIVTPYNKSAPRGHSLWQQTQFLQNIMIAEKDFS